MGIEIPLDDIDPEKIGGFAKVKKGRYHVAVVSQQEFGGKDNDSLVVDFEVQSGTDMSQVGMTHREYFQHSGKGVGRTLQLAVACGLTTQEEIAAHKKAGRPLPLNFADCVGKHLIIGIEEEEYPKNSGTIRAKVNFDIHALGSDKAKGVPINEGSLKAAGVGGNKQGGGNESAPVDPFAAIV